MAEATRLLGLYSSMSRLTLTGGLTYPYAFSLSVSFEIASTIIPDNDLTEHF